MNEQIFINLFTPESASKRCKSCKTGTFKGCYYIRCGLSIEYYFSPVVRKVLAYYCAISSYFRGCLVAGLYCLLYLFFGLQLLYPIF